MKLTKEELGVLTYAREVLAKHLHQCRKLKINPNPGSFVLSTKGKIYHGIALDTGIRTVHGEENAIGTMCTEESEKSRIKVILIISGTDEISMPCGICRCVIYSYKTKKTSILCANLSLSKVKKFTISELYPYPYIEPELSPPK